ncbi:MAG: Alkaline phosphatase [Ktedonobacterales bacterium]|jgi:hypothetical protein|nr:MAG: Alkaline phosphatase [Ktedonobacterales bacterium]
MADDIGGEPGMSDGAATHTPIADSANSATSPNNVIMARNVASVAAIPWEELSDGPARGCLLEMAYSGGDVGAFRAADGRWWVRLGSGAELCAAWASRFCV